MTVFYPDLSALEAGDREFQNNLGPYPTLREVYLPVLAEKNIRNPDVAHVFVYRDGCRNMLLVRASWDHTGRTFTQELQAKALLTPKDVLRFYDGDCFPLGRTFREMEDIIESQPYASKRKDVKVFSKTYSQAFLLEVKVKENLEVNSSDSSTDNEPATVPEDIRVRRLHGRTVHAGMYAVKIFRHNDNRSRRRSVLKFEARRDCTMFEVLKYGERTERIRLIDRAKLAMAPRLELTVGAMIEAKVEPDNTLESQDVELTFTFPPKHLGGPESDSD